METLILLLMVAMIGGPCAMILCAIVNRRA